jgi:hypothetical protein
MAKANPESELIGPVGAGTGLAGLIGGGLGVMKAYFGANPPINDAGLMVVSGGTLLLSSFLWASARS